LDPTGAYTDARHLNMLVAPQLTFIAAITNGYQAFLMPKDTTVISEHWSG
jgi:hypothetical protein